GASNSRPAVRPHRRRGHRPGHAARVSLAAGGRAAATGMEFRRQRRAAAGLDAYSTTQRLAGSYHDIAQQAVERDRFFQSKVRSPFVAPMLDTGEHELFGTFIVTPRYPATLYTRMLGGTLPVTLEWSMRTLEQVLLGLIDSWRTAGCIHLDIKPAPPRPLLRRLPARRTWMG